MIRQCVERMTAYQPGEQPVAPAVVKLNTNENPYPPSPRVAAALRALDAAWLRRYPDPDCAELRKMLGRQHGCTPSQVFVGNGSDEILALCTRAFVENDGAIGYTVPSYSLYPVLAAMRGVEQRPVELGADFGLVLPEDTTASLFLLTNPNAPTGIQYPRQQVRRLCEAAAGVVVLDEAYVDFADDDGMGLALELPNTIVARTLSKSYSLAGLRLGYAVGPEPLIGALHKIKDSYNVDAAAQALAAAALSDRRSMKRNVMRIRATRERLSVALREMGFSVYPSQTNFVWAEPGGMGAAELFAALRERGILIRYFDAPRTRAYVRITVGTDKEIDRLLAAIGELLA